MSSPYTPPPMLMVDLFAGPGGWSQGHRMARPQDLSVGLEWDASACATARAAGHARIQGDIAEWDPFLVEDVFGRVDYLHASPPCQGFSLSGSGKGRKDADRLITTIKACVVEDYEQVDDQLAEFDLLANDPRSVLTLEPLRWAARLEPRYLSLEQVPSVLPIWEAYAEVLRAAGYAVWTGILNAEQYGVPQTRRRAILMAKRGIGAQVAPPTPTHSRYHNRTPDRLDPGVLPWVSMAETLGWGMGARPSMTVTGGGSSTGGAEPFGNGARKGMRREKDAGRWEDRVNNQSGTEFDYPDQASKPATVVQGRGLAPFRGTTANAHNGSTKSRNDGFRVSVEEAGILQSFPDGYPWQGTKSKKHEQVGNAVPPFLAAAIVAALVGGDS